LAEQLCEALATKLEVTKPDVVVSPAMGGLLVGHEVARKLKLRHIFTEKNSAGELELRRGFQIAPGEKAIVVDDVITKGGRVQETIDIIRVHGGKVVGVGALVDRSPSKLKLPGKVRSVLDISGGRRDPRFKFLDGYLYSLLPVHVRTYKPDKCPLCKRSIPLVKPGS
jgi:orotate phosphoribosyltransferase